MNDAIRTTSTRTLSKPLLVFVAVVIVLTALATVAFMLDRRIWAAYELFGATWQTHDMLVKYMKDNDGRWPANWSDLQSAFSYNNQGYGAPSIEWLRSRVAVNFGVDLTSIGEGLASAESSWLIRLADGSSNSETIDANERLWDLIQSKATPQSD